MSRASTAIGVACVAMACVGGCAYVLGVSDDVSPESDGAVDAPSFVMDGTNDRGSFDDRSATNDDASDDAGDDGACAEAGEDGADGC